MRMEPGTFLPEIRGKWYDVSIMSLTREQFVDRVSECVAAKFPLVKLGPGDGSFSVRINGNLASLENLYRMALLRPEEMRRQIERWMVELLRAAEGAPDMDGSFEELKDRIMPMVVPEGAPASVSLSQPLVNGLSISYAIDNDRTISYVSPERFDRWKLSLDQLHEQAMTNLVGKSESMSASAAQDEDGKVYLILFQTMDGYDASRVLLPTLHDRLREYLGSPFVAGIPTRDILLCFRNDEDTVGKLRPQIEKDFAQMPHQVTDKLLLVTADGIALREG